MMNSFPSPSPFPFPKMGESARNTDFDGLVMQAFSGAEFRSVGYGYGYGYGYGNVCATETARPGDHSAH